MIKLDAVQGGHRLRSQIHGLGTNVVVPRLESAPCDDVDPDTQQFLKFLEQADMIKKRRT